MSGTATITEAPILIRNVESLNATDRCDHGDCGARANTLVTLTSGLQLTFCGHHTNEMREKLTELKAKIDELVEA